MENQICEAIENQNIIEFYYDGELRVVEPHCYGVTTAGNEGLRAYQVDGYSSSGNLGWKMYDMGKADDLNVTKQKFNSARSGYNPNDKGMSKIYCAL